MHDRSPRDRMETVLGYLEWFSQNGRVVIQLADPLIEFLDSGKRNRYGRGNIRPC